MWQCTKCHSKIEDSFDVCWSCGTTKDGVEDPDFQPADDGDATAAGGSEERDDSAVRSAKSAPSAKAPYGTAPDHLLAHLLILALRVLAVVVFVWGVIVLGEMIAAGNKAARLRGPAFDQNDLAQAVERAQTNALFRTVIEIASVVCVLLALAEALRIFILIEVNTRGAQTPHLRERGRRQHQ